jgi:hypothetical protein
MSGKNDAANSFFSKLGAAIGEATHGAIADIRHRWEEAWFGREVTPEVINDMAKDLGWREDVTKDMRASWDALCAELARQRQPEHSRDHEPDLDR